MITLELYISLYATSQQSSVEPPIKKGSAYDRKRGMIGAK